MAMLVLKRVSWFRGQLSQGPVNIYVWSMSRIQRCSTSSRYPQEAWFVLRFLLTWLHDVVLGQVCVVLREPPSKGHGHQIVGLAHFGNIDSGDFRQPVFIVVTITNTPYPPPPRQKKSNRQRFLSKSKQV